QHRRHQASCVTMNKKKLPRAIRPTTADTSGLGPALGAAAPDSTAPRAGSKAEATMENEAASADAPGMPPARRPGMSMKPAEPFSLWSGAAGLIPLPFVGLAAVGGVQIQMLRRISQIYDVPFFENRGKSIVAGLAGSMIPAS